MEGPLFSLGVIADVQYVDADNGWDFHRTKERHYRACRPALQRAVRCFADARVACVLQLGDLIDGQAKDRDAWATMQALVADLDAAGAPVFHCVGNHELYCLPKDVALAVTRQSAWRIARTVPGHASWKVVVLDAYEVSTLDPASAPAAEAVLAARNPNDWRSVKADWLTGLNGTDRRFVPFNGALGSVQLEWLRRELDAPGTNVIICSHVSICPGSASDECLVWDYEEALEVIESCAASVVAVLSGHDHAGGYAERAGIPYVTIQSPMLAPNLGHSDAHALLHVYPDRVELVGFGSVPSRRFPLVKSAAL